MQSLRSSSWVRSKNCLAVAAAAALGLFCPTVFGRADTLIQSFETGGFDEPGDPDVTTTPLQTSGVTNGSFSLRVDSTNTSFWTDPGHILVPNASDVINNSILKFDVTTSTGVQFVPIFLTDTGSTYYQAPGGFFVGASPASQTISFDYGGLGLPVDATQIRIRLQLSNGNPVSFFLDNVRVAPAAIVLGGSAEWVTNGNGAWVDGPNWNTGTPPGALGSDVTFGTGGGSVNTASQIVVNLDQTANPANLNFDKGGGGYRITGGSAISLTANVNVISGNHQISTPLNASNGSIFSVADNSSIIIDNLGGGGFGLYEKTGNGTLTADKIQNVNLLISAGVVNLKPGNAQNNGFIYGLDVLNGSQFNMNGAVLRTNSLASNEVLGTINLGTGGVMNTGIYGAANYFGAITGDGNVIIGGTLIDDSAPAQICTLGGVNSYTGTTEVRNGNTLIANSSANLGSGAVTNYLILNEGILQASASFGMSRRVNVAAGGGTIDTNGFEMTVGAVDGGAFTKAGAGLLIADKLDNLVSANVSTGSLRLASNTTSASKVQSLTLGTGAALDVGSEALVVDYTGTSPLSDLRDKIIAGYAGGSWNGVGINSSTAATVAGGAVGYAEASQIFTSFPASFRGQSVDADSAVIAYTLQGDANLDGTVNISDFALLAANFNTTSVWYRGDFNYDGSTNISDFALLASRFNQSLPAPRTSVPEPAAAGLLLAVAAVARRRRA